MSSSLRSKSGWSHEIKGLACSALALASCTILASWARLCLAASAACLCLLLLRALASSSRAAPSLRQLDNGVWAGIRPCEVISGVNQAR